MTDAQTLPADKPGYRFYVLAILIFVYMLNFLDRQIIGILAAPLMAHFGLSDSQFGLLGGIAFASVYSTLAIPLAWLADRFSRVWIMTGALAVWSGFTALCGVATSFTQLFLFRMGVGVGEAGGVAPAYSLVADYFPPHQRARALAAFAFGIPIGTAAGTLVGGLLAVAYGWQTAFIVVGLLGLLVAPLLRLTVKDPRRGATDIPKAVETTAPVEGAPVASHPLPVRSSRPGLIAAQIMFGLAGIWLGGVVADRLGRTSRGGYPLVPAIAFLISAPCFILAMNSDWLIAQVLPGGGTQVQALTVAFLIFLIPTGLNLAWLGPITASVQHLVPAPMRSTASALFLLINNLLGIAVGFYYFGWMSDLLAPRFGDESLRWAIYTGMGFYVLASVLLIGASRTLKRDWVD